MPASTGPPRQQRRQSGRTDPSKGPRASVRILPLLLLLLLLAASPTRIFCESAADETCNDPASAHSHSTSSRSSNTMLLIVGTYSEKLGHVDGKGKGVYVLRIDNDTLRPVGADSDSENSNSFFGKPQLGSGPSRIRNPTYLTAHRDAQSSEIHVYIVDEREDGAGTVTAAILNEQTGQLTQLGPAIPADDRNEGAAACHVSVSPDERFVLVANYLCGSIVAIGRNDDGSLDTENVQYVHLGDGIEYPRPNVNRQERSHAHMVLFSPGKSSTSILIPDLGSDVVWSVPYLGGNDPNASPDANGTTKPLGRPVPTGRHPTLAGGGPRHVALHPSGKVCYVAYELASLVASFEIDEETGAIVGEPLGVVNVLDGELQTSSFLSGSSSESNERGERRHDHLLKESSTGLTDKYGAKVCSDKHTSVAAIRALDDGTAVLVSSRLVDGEGTISTITLGPDGELLASGEHRGARRSVIIAGTLGRTPRDFIALPTPRRNKLPNLTNSASMSGGGDDGGGGGGEEKVAVLVANQDTDSIVLLQQGREAEVLTEKVPTPVCLCIAPS